MRLVLMITASVVINLGFAVALVGADERCCFKMTIRDGGASVAQWGKVSDNQIGEEGAAWDWVERMILEYRDPGSLILARLGEATVPPSSYYHRFTRSSVQIKGVRGYSPAASPGACGEFNLKLRRGVTPSLVPRGEADPDDRSQFPNAPFFLDAGSITAREDIGCLYGITLGDAEFADEEPCTGQHAFRLPAPALGYFRTGLKRIEKTAYCTGGHTAGGFENSEVSSTATVTVAIKWFPRRELENFAERLKKAHSEL